MLLFRRVDQGVNGAVVKFEPLAHDLDNFVELLLREIIIRHGRFDQQSAGGEAKLVLPAGGFG